MITLFLEDINKNENISTIRDHLENDGLIIYPTDTLYGIGCNFFSVTARKKIDKIKGRSGIPYSAIVSDIKMLTDLANVNPIFSDLIINLLPGKVTLITKISSGIDPGLVSNEKTVGIRIPDIAEILRLVKSLDFPIISTSVNISSNKPINSIVNLKNFIYGLSIENDIILIDGGNLPESKGSTVIDITKKYPEILREGDNLNRVKKYISGLNI